MVGAYLAEQYPIVLHRHDQVVREGGARPPPSRAVIALCWPLWMRLPWLPHPCAAFSALCAPLHAKKDLTKRAAACISYCERGSQTKQPHL